MSEVWYEQALTPDADVVEKTIENDPLGAIREQIRQFARVTVRIHQPRWAQIKPNTDKGTRLLTSGKTARYYQIRLGFEFDLPEDVRRSHVQIVEATCRAYLPASCQEQPTVYELYPRELTEGAPQNVNIKLGVPALGEIGTDVALGMVEPTCRGYKGKDERAPYWVLQPKGKALLGIRHFWLVVEVPESCPSFRLIVRAEAQAQGMFGRLRLGDKVSTLESLPSVLIS